MSMNEILAHGFYFLHESFIVLTLQETLCMKSSVFPVPSVFAGVEQRSIEEVHLLFFCDLHMKTVWWGS
jgi:hypothetical protein